MPPVAWIGLSSVWMTSPSTGSGFELAQVLGERLAGDRQRVAVQQALVEHAPS